MASLNPFRQRLRSNLFDTTIVLGTALFALIDVFAIRPWVGLVGFVAAGSLLWRRHRPVTVFAVAVALSAPQPLIWLVTGDWIPASSATVVVVFVAMYSVVKYAERLREGWLAGGVVLLGGAVEPFASFRRVQEQVPLAVMAVTVGVAVWLSGLAMRNRRLFIESLKERAVTAERERDHLARIAVAEERARIARELHDVVAHSLSVIIVQADGAQYTMEQDPERARQALRTVSSTGREALDEMRRLVAVLRGGEGSRREVVERPTAALAELGALTDRARAAGLVASFQVAGEPPRLSPGVELAVYRIAQEAVTNAIKHAGPGSALDLAVSFAPATVEVVVRDDGGGQRGEDHGGDERRLAGAGGGNGLVGMRERVALYGGAFSAGPLGGGGWLVRATIPTRGTRGEHADRLSNI